MNIRSALLVTAAISAIACTGAQAATKHTVTHKTTVKKTSTGVSNAELIREIDSLKAQVAEMRAQTNAAAATNAQTAAAAQAAQAQAAQVAQMQQQLAVLPTKEQVDGRIATAIDKEHHNDKFYFKGITITPGGFLELAGIYRDHFQGNDISSSFSANFPNSRQYYQHEGRFTARQSRVSFLAEGQINKNVKAAMYGEFDFQGAAQTANSNGSNSYNPRIRNLYGTIDWNQGSYGLHLLAGQNWSLVTMQSKGISPRSEVTPPQIDAQYVPGFAWARQPGVRLTADFLDHSLWLAVAAENPQNNTIVSVNGVTTNGTVPAAPTTEASGTTGGSGFNSLNNNSFSDVPDIIGKVAYEANFAGHGVHLEAFGILRTFNERLLVPSATNHSITSVGYGGSVNVQVVPKILDVQFSGFGGQGIGRYGTSGLADVVYSTDGRVHPIDEMMLLAGATLHATKALDLYGFAGEEQEYKNKYVASFGAPTTTSAGCFVEGGACGQGTRSIRQLTVGFWDKFYQGSFGRAQVGIQYSHTERQLFYSNDIAGFAKAKENMAFLAFRYYPF